MTRPPIRPTTRATPRPTAEAERPTAWGATRIRTAPAPAGEVRLATAAQLLHVPPAQVRHDVELGLVRPSRVEGAVVYFGDAELAQLRRIRRMRRDLGLNSAGIEVVLRLLDEIGRLRDELQTTETGSGTRRGRRPSTEA